jgi:hypothetical protein
VKASPPAKAAEAYTSRVKIMGGVLMITSRVMPPNVPDIMAAGAGGGGHSLPQELGGQIPEGYYQKTICVTICYACVLIRATIRDRTLIELNPGPWDQGCTHIKGL